MPPIRRRKAKARKSREMDMMSDSDNLDIMLGNENINPIERELANTIGNQQFSMTMNLINVQCKTFLKEINLEILIMEIMFLDVMGF